jgi:type 1 fimbria pilin
MLMVVANGPLANAVQIGSAQFTTTGNVSGFVIFRYNPNGQEAVVPLENRNAHAYLLAFDNTAGTATGVAINSVSSQAVNVPVIIRDDAGNQLATDTLNLAADGHLAFTLGTDKYPATTNIRGTIEFDSPPGSQIGALGIRIPVAHTFTTLPALAR